MGDECKACFRTADTEPVEIRRGERGEPWVESSIRRCANAECRNTTGGTLEERLWLVRNAYGYKYFGDYELSPEQNDAVWEAKAIAETVPGLLEVLKEAVEDLEQTHRWRGEGWECSEEEHLGPYRAAIAKAEGRS